MLSRILSSERGAQIVEIAIICALIGAAGIIAALSVWLS